MQPADAPARAAPGRRTRLLLLVLALAALWAGLYAAGLRPAAVLMFLHDQFEQHMIVGLVVFAAAFTLGNLVQLPGWVFLAAAVLSLGPLWGGLTTYVAACTSSLLIFLLVRRLGADALRQFDGRAARWLFGRLDARPTQSVALLRLLFQTVPALNYALALSGVALRPFLVGTLLGLPLPIALYSLFFDRIAVWLHWPLPPALQP